MSKHNDYLSNIHCKNKGLQTVPIDQATSEQQSMRSVTETIFVCMCVQCVWVWKDIHLGLGGYNMESIYIVCNMYYMEYIEWLLLISLHC